MMNLPYRPEVGEPQDRVRVWNDLGEGLGGKTVGPMNVLDQATRRACCGSYGVYGRMRRIHFSVSLVPQQCADVSEQIRDLLGGPIDRLLEHTLDLGPSDPQ